MTLQYLLSVYLVASIASGLIVLFIYLVVTDRS